MEIESGTRAVAPFDLRRAAAQGNDSRAASKAEGVPGQRAMRRRSDAAPGVTLSLSARAAERLEGRGAERSGRQGEKALGRTEQSESTPSASREAPGELTPEEQEEVEGLRKRDAEVRAHENAHKAAAGRHARGGPTYEFERGPDGRRYAVGGEVSIDTSPVKNDPDATIQKMQQVRRAALAPAQPSPQDRLVASQASRTENAARSEKQREMREENARGTEDGGVIPARTAGRPLSPYQSPPPSRRGGALDLKA